VAGPVCQACLEEHLVCRGNPEAREGFPAVAIPAALDFQVLGSPAFPVDQCGQVVLVLIRHGRLSRANHSRRCENGGAICPPQIASGFARMPNAGST
jgi:hypothetical protein